MNVSSLLSAPWKGYQDTSNNAKAGCAIAINTQVFEPAGDFTLTLGVKPNGQKMETRYIAKLPVKNIETGERIDLISGHEPPKRYSELQPTYTNNLKKVINNSTNPIVGVDANMPIGTLANKVGLTYAYGEGIIGILTDTPATSVDVTKQQYSDHPSVTIQYED